MIHKLIIVYVNKMIMSLFVNLKPFDFNYLTRVLDVSDN